jgi:eukaryotic sulfide quinone oxidoreductase
MPTMFAVPKYSVALDKIRERRGIKGQFEHNLVSIDSAKHRATFAKPDGTKVETDYSLLHVTPPMGPLEFIKKSPLADSVGWVDVDPGSLRHKNKDFGNVFSLGDCSSLPTSKTAAAITAQAPIVAENVFSVLEKGDVNPNAVYDGYTSCPVSSCDFQVRNNSLLTATRIALDWIRRGIYYFPVHTEFCSRR